MKIKLLFIFVILISLNTNAQTVTALQQQNARATGYAIVAARNPGKSFAVLLVKWDGVNTLDYNATTQINPGWHAQAAVKGNYFNQTFDGSDFTMYSSVVVSQTEFDNYKSYGNDWWIVCSTLPAFSSSGLTIADNGNVGIGTASPSTKLDIVSGNADGINFKYNQGYGNSSIGLLYDSGSDVGNSMAFKINNATGSAAERLRILGNGNIGIGTTSPTYKLDINSSGVNGLKLSGYQSNNFITLNNVLSENNRSFRLIAGIDNVGYNGFSILDTYTNISRFVIDNVGNIGIGTTNPDEKLTVKGKIHTQEVKVDLQGACVPDYVFANDYQLKTLPQVEQYIKENSHLPEIPSALEIEKNGLMLAEMNMSLLKKLRN